MEIESLLHAAAASLGGVTGCEVIAFGPARDSRGEECARHCLWAGQPVPMKSKAPAMAYVILGRDRAPKYKRRPARR